MGFAKYLIVDLESGDKTLYYVENAISKSAKIEAPYSLNGRTTQY